MVAQKSQTKAPDRARDDDGLADLVRDDRVNSRIYTDPEIFEAEMERIFHRGWVYVAHETEIPEPGDYKTTMVGRQPVIVNRSSDDAEVQVMFNRCRHRATTVCDQHAGNANYFRCPYHGWTYNSCGELVGVPYREGYGDDFDMEDLGLVHVGPGRQLPGFRLRQSEPRRTVAGGAPRQRPPLPRRNHGARHRSPRGRAPLCLRRELEAATGEHRRQLSRLGCPQGVPRPRRAANRKPD